MDDEENILNSLRRGLIDEEYKCIFASSGLQALEALKNEPVSVIVSDMRMPGMDGLTLLKEVKENYPRTVRIVLSGYAQLQQIITTLNQANLFKFILKPWNLEGEFKGVIQQALEYYRLQEERDEFEETLKRQNQAYQNILKKFEDVMSDAKKNAEVQALIGISAFDIILREMTEVCSSDMIKRKLEISSAILKAISGISSEEKSEKSLIEFSNEIKEKITSKGVKTVELEVKGNEKDMVKTNYRLIYSLLNIVVDRLNGETKHKNVKISCVIEPVDGERMFSLYVFVENITEVDTTLLKNELKQHLDTYITVLNPLFARVMQLLKGSFHCARVDINLVAKFKFPA
ncbi:MAG: response regulator [Desulfosporosinus sp.]|nr:response regulator [Desulfosporosinus sp.]